MIDLTNDEWEGMKSKILTLFLPKGGKVKLPKAFTEKGLYMLATILKSEQAIETTIAIIEAFSKLRELSRNINALSCVKDEQQKNSALQKSGDIITGLLGDTVFSMKAKQRLNLILQFSN